VRAAVAVSSARMVAARVAFAHLAAAHLTASHQPGGQRSHRTRRSVRVRGGASCDSHRLPATESVTSPLAKSRQYNSDNRHSRRKISGMRPRQTRSRHAGSMPGRGSPALAGSLTSSDGITASRWFGRPRHSVGASDVTCLTTCNKPAPGSGEAPAALATELFRGIPPHLSLPPLGSRR
jgi:hypothetical protein